MLVRSSLIKRASELALAVTAIAALSIASASASQKKFKYNLASGTASAPITLPASAVNTPISITGVQIVDPFPGVGQATLLRGVSPQIPVLIWDSISFATLTPTRNFITNPTTTSIVTIDFNGNVDIATFSLTQIFVRNNSGTQATGVVTLTW